MVKFVTCDEISEGQNRYRVVARDAAAQPGFFVERSKQSEAGLAHVRVLFHHIRKFSRTEPCAANIILLLKTCKRRLVSAREPQGAVREDPLRVGDMPEHFLNGPLARRVTEIAVALASP